MELFSRQGFAICLSQQPLIPPIQSSRIAIGIIAPFGISNESGESLHTWLSRSYGTLARSPSQESSISTIPLAAAVVVVDVVAAGGRRKLRHLPHTLLRGRGRKT